MTDSVKALIAGTTAAVVAGLAVWSAQLWALAIAAVLVIIALGYMVSARVGTW